MFQFLYQATIQVLFYVPTQVTQLSTLLIEPLGLLLLVLFYVPTQVTLLSTLSIKPLGLLLLLRIVMDMWQWNISAAAKRLISMQ